MINMRGGISDDGTTLRTCRRITERIQNYQNKNSKSHFGKQEEENPTLAHERSKQSDSFRFQLAAGPSFITGVNPDIVLFRSI